MEVILANPRGFCAGVDRAIDIVERALELFGAPVYVRHEVVHNRYVVDGLRERGAIFVEELDQVPEGATVIFSAHGVSTAVQKTGEGRDLRIFDATCPLVTKVHLEVARYAREDMDVILIGHAGHPEVEGTMGRYSAVSGAIHLVESVDDVEQLQVSDASRLAFVSQTTLSVDDTRAIAEALKQRFPEIRTPRQDDICYATQNRQDAVKQLCEQVDLVLVVGSANSSNSNRLCEIAVRAGRAAYLVNGAEDIDPRWLDGVSRIGVTAGASAPEILVRNVVEKLRSLGASTDSELDGVTESIVFPLPKALRQGL